MPNGLIQDDSLRVHPEGLALSLTLPWYRSLWLSSVSSLQLTVDGIEIPAEDLAFELKGVRYSLDELPQQSEVLWYLQEHPLLIAARVTRRSSSVRPTRCAWSASCACRTCRSLRVRTAGPACTCPTS